MDWIKRAKDLGKPSSWFEVEGEIPNFRIYVKPLHMKVHEFESPKPTRLVEFERLEEASQLLEQAGKEIDEHTTMIVNHEARIGIQADVIKDLYAAIEQIAGTTVHSEHSSRTNQHLAESAKKLVARDMELLVRK